MQSQKSLNIVLGFILITLIISGCNAAVPGGLYVWIDVPQDGISYAELQPVIVKGHATGKDGISRIELYVEDELWRAVDDPEVVDDLARFEFEWLPPEMGAYTLEAIAYDLEGNASQRDDTTIFFGLTPTPVVTLPPVISITPPVTDTPTPVPPGEPSVLFWADPVSFEAGDCTDIRWIAENVQRVVLGGVEQPFEGEFQVCLCASETYSLRITYLDDSEEIFQVNINVEGSCEEEDNDPPPAPALSSPGNGVALTCRSFQDLVWNEVSDPSGISQYQLSVQRHYGDFNWVAVPGSVFSGISSTSKNIPVGCGSYYRWRVLAVDGKGNTGPWSNWWGFVVNLE